MSGAIFTKDITDKIKEEFYKIEDFPQFISLLNYISSCVYDTAENRKKITEKSFRYLLKTKDSRYIAFDRTKKTGEPRRINAPDRYLKYVQGLIYILLDIIFHDKVHYCANGFIRGRGILRNAIPHVNKRYVLNIDLKDFFPSIHFWRIKTVLSLNPFNLGGSREKIAFYIANICTHNGVLPQGAPTSPILSNIVTQKLDRKISAYCNKKQVKYSRYADDLTFSTNKNLFNKKFLNDITKAIKEFGLNINENKTRLKKSGDRQEVTGITVNKKPNVKKERRKEVRAILHNWEKEGITFAKKRFFKFYRNDKGEPDFRNVLGGYIEHIGLVLGREDKLYLKNYKKYNFLKHRINYSFITDQRVRERLINDNIEMENYYCNRQGKNGETFIRYCTAAFHQVENLLYYFYWKRFPDNSDLCEYLYNNNEELRKRYKQMPKYGKIGDIQINHLVYIFEKEFYFDRKISYNKEITFLRNARNDDSHRCMINNLNISDVKEQYQKIVDYNKKYFEQNKVKRPLTETENKIKQTYRFVRFMEDQSYNRVRDILFKMVTQIENFPETSGML